MQARNETIVNCGSLDVTAPHNPTGSGTIGKCDFVGVGMVSLEEVSHDGGRL